MNTINLAEVAELLQQNAELRERFDNARYLATESILTRNVNKAYETLNATRGNKELYIAALRQWSIAKRELDAFNVRNS
jgi:hypothetical protein